MLITVYNTIDKQADKQTDRQTSSAILSIIHTMVFIHSENLYSASSRELAYSNGCTPGHPRGASTPIISGKSSISSSTVFSLAGIHSRLLVPPLSIPCIPPVFRDSRVHAILQN